MIIEEKVQWIRRKDDHKIYKVILLSLVTGMLTYQLEKVASSNKLENIKRDFEWAENIGDWKDFEL